MEGNHCYLLGRRRFLDILLLPRGIVQLPGQPVTRGGSASTTNYPSLMCSLWRAATMGWHDLRRERGCVQHTQHLFLRRLAVRKGSIRLGDAEAEATGLLETRGGIKEVVERHGIV